MGGVTQGHPKGKEKQRERRRSTSKSRPNALGKKTNKWKAAVGACLPREKKNRTQERERKKPSTEGNTDTSLDQEVEDDQGGHRLYDSRASHAFGKKGNW